jgi:signal transduction histidine kinase
MFDFSSPYTTIETYSIVSEFILAALALVVFVSSNDLEWTIISAGLACLPLGDTVMHLDKMAHNSEYFDVNSMFVTTGLYLALSAVTYSQRSPIPRIDTRKSLVKTKIEVLLLGAFIALLFITLVGTHILTSLVSPLVGAVVLFGSFFTYNRYIDDESEMAIIGRLQRQINHDIKGPIATISEVVIDGANRLTVEERAQIRSGLARISDIVSSPLRKGVDAPDITSEIVENDVYPRMILFRLVSEVRRRNKNSRVSVVFNTSPNSYSLFIRANESEVLRALSNLMDNSLKSLGDSGRIEVSLSRSQGVCLIEIKDSGCGIPASILPTLGKPGAAFGAKRGTGLGLNQAIESVKAAGGTLSISSTERIGTTVNIEFPTQTPPPWFLREISIQSSSQVVILDDEPIAHSLWNKRLGQAKGLHLIHCDSVTEFEKVVSSVEKDALFLIDYELMNEPVTGLDLIRKHDIASASILVTTQFRAVKKRFREVKKECVELGVHLLPLGAIPEIKILVDGAPVKESRIDFGIVSAVLIDDNPDVRFTWELYAKRHGIGFLAFASVDEFKSVVDSIPPTAHIYIDFDLGTEVTGLTEAIFIRDTMGFKVTLATGADELPDTDGIPVIDKAPPWKSY